MTKSSGGFLKTIKGSVKMGYRTLAVIVTDQTADLPALTAAGDIAAREGGHLDIYCLGIDPTRYEPLPIGSALAVMETGAAEASARAKELAKWADQVLADVPNKSIEPLVLPHLGLETGVGRIARYSDVIICARPYGRASGPVQVAALEAALFGTGAPVIVVGTDMQMPETMGRVLLAWDESPEALTALRHALPMMQEADRVDVVMVDPPSHSPERSDPGGALCVMLARHGIKAEVSILARTLPRVSDCLVRFAREHNCGMVVMGAYGHSRLREAMIGGPTREMLEASEVPLFMAH